MRVATQTAHPRPGARSTQHAVRQVGHREKGATPDQQRRRMPAHPREEQSMKSQRQGTLRGDRPQQPARDASEKANQRSAQRPIQGSAKASSRRVRRAASAPSVGQWYAEYRWRTDGSAARTYNGSATKAKRQTECTVGQAMPNAGSCSGRQRGRGDACAAAVAHDRETRTTAVRNCGSEVLRREPDAEEQARERRHRAPLRRSRPLTWKRAALARAGARW